MDRGWVNTHPLSRVYSSRFMGLKCKGVVTNGLVRLLVTPLLGSYKG